MNLLTIVQLFLAGVVPASVWGMFAQSIPEAAPITTWTSVGTTTAAVGALVLVTQRMVRGELISRSTDEVDRRFEAIIGQLEQLVTETKGTNDRLAELVGDAHSREADYLALLRQRFDHGHHGD